MTAKSPAILWALAVVWGVAPAHASAGVSEATARVSARVLPSIAVSGPAVVSIDLPDHPSHSLILGQIDFSVRANTTAVDLYVACTDLCRAGDPASAYKVPVADGGAQITCAQGSQIGGCGLLPWRNTPARGDLPPGWSGAVSEVGTFTTSTAATFSQTVTIGVSWQVPDHVLPAGEYRGFVKLIGMVRP